MTVERPAPGWSAYWNGIDDKKIFAEEARDHVARLRAAVPLRTTDVVLDFGCGFGHVVELLGPLVREVAFWDAAENVRRIAAGRTEHVPHAVEVDLSDARTLPIARYDLVIATSVIQYMRRDELALWLASWRSMLRPEGRIVLSDVPTPDLSGLSELTDMLAFAARHGFLLEALRDGVREARRYSRTRHLADLLRLTPDDLVALAAEAGLVGERLSANLTHRAGRFTVVLRQP